MATLGDLIVNVGANIAGFKSAMGDVSSTATSTAATASTAASKINAVFSAAFGAGITTLAFSAANKFESAFVQIQRSTGATEEKLKSLEGSFTAVYKQTAASSEDVAAALSILSTRTGATGKDLEDLTLKTIKLAKTQREDLNTIVPLVTRAFGDWSIASNQQGKAMDYLRTVSQQTGSSVARLAEQVVYAGAPLRQLGYGFEESAALIGKFEKEGVNTELVLGGMKAALQKFAKDGVTDTAQAWREFVEGVRSGNITLQDVMTQVGAKRGVDLYRAITEGRFEIDEMVKSSKKLAEEGGANMETFKTKITKITHEIETVIAGHSQLIMAIGFGMPVVTAFGGAFKTVGVAAVGAISNIVTAIRLEMIPALTLVETSLLGIIAILPAVIAGYMAWVNIQKEYHPDSSKPETVFDTSGGYTFSGFGLTRTPQTKVPNAADYVKNLPAPKDLGQTPAAPAPGAKLGGGSGAESHQFTIEASLAFDRLQASISRAKQALTEFYSGAANVPTSFADEIDKAGKSVSFISQILTPTLDQIKELPVETSAAGAAMKSGFTPEVLDAANAVLLSARNAEITTQAYHEMGLKTPEELKNVADAAKTNYNIIKAAAGSAATATQIAWTEAMLAEIDADQELKDADLDLWTQRKKMAEDTLAKLKGTSKDTTDHIRRDYYDLGRELEQMGHRTFDSLERDLAKNLISMKGWADTGKSIITGFAEDFSSIMLKGALKPVEDAFAGLAGKIGGWLGGLFGGGGGGLPGGGKGNNTPSVPGGGGGGGGVGSAVGGLSGILNTAFSGISAATGVFSIFQNMHQETSLNAIEHNTRFLQIEAEKFFQQDEWQRHEGLLLKLDDIWGEIRNVVGHVGGGSSGALDTIRDYAVLQVKKLDEFIVPRMDTMIDLLRGGSAGTAAPITINVHGTDVNETVNRITRHLKARGVYV